MEVPPLSVVLRSLVKEFKGSTNEITQHRDTVRVVELYEHTVRLGSTYYGLTSYGDSLQVSMLFS